MQTIAKTLASAFLILAIAQCSSSDSEPKKTCAAADVRACVGPGACTGEQMCYGDGTQWGACVCKATLPDAAADVAADVAIDAPFTPSYVLIDDMEAKPAQNGPLVLPVGANQLHGYWGSWYSTLSPLNVMVPNPFAYEVLPAPHATMDGVTSQTAAHLVCTIADLYGYCEQGIWLAQDPSTTAVDAGPSDVTARVPYDISAHHGLVFWAMSGKRNRVKVMFNNRDTDVFGNRCGQADASSEQCWDAFSKYVTLTETWQRYEVKLSELLQQGWGHAAPSGKFDTTSVYLIAFQVDGPASKTAPPVETDFWIDDVYFE